MQFHQYESPIRKNAFLQSLKAQNWVLYYSLLSRHLSEVVPIIYTPTEVCIYWISRASTSLIRLPKAEAISDYSHLFRRSEGLYLSFPNVETMEEDFLAQLEGRNVELVVCSDAEAILGIGDQGVGVRTLLYFIMPCLISHEWQGIGVSSPCNTLPGWDKQAYRFRRRKRLSTGQYYPSFSLKLDPHAVFSLIGGIDPAKTLPVMLDVGTNNADLLEDDLYVVGSFSPCITLPEIPICTT